MAKLTKRIKAIKEKVTPGVVHKFEDAISLLKDLSTVKFNESVEISVNLGVDPRKSDQVVRGATTLPHGTGKSVRVAVFTQGANADAAKEAGADVVGMDDLAADMKAGNLNYDVVIASPDAMRVVGQLGQVLGPKGLMPNPKTGTVTMDVTKAINDIKAGKVEYRVDKVGNIHVTVGKVSFSADKLAENVKTMYEALIRIKPSTVKGTYVNNVTIATTMGPGVKIDGESILA